MKIIALTGAGISKQSHIPTFMERPDVREKLFRSYAKRHPEEYNEVIQQLKANMNGAKPNDAHLALAEYKIPIITMNIDGLHRLAGSDALELHGGLPDVYKRQDVACVPLSYVESLDSPYILPQDQDNMSKRILYFESSRGCPFQCQYCLSSLEKGRCV